MASRSIYGDLATPALTGGTIPFAKRLFGNTGTTPSGARTAAGPAGGVKGTSTGAPRGAPRPGQPHPTTPGFPGGGSSYKGQTTPVAGPAAPPQNPYGSESGNTYLEDRYISRLYGDDPAFNYASKRGMEALGNRSAAAGNFNSGAARQQEGDFMANLTAQSQAQLDALSAGATGARQNKTDSMYRTLLGLAGGQSGINTAYDLKAGDTMSDALSALLGYTTGKAGVDDKSNQQGFKNIIGLGGLFG